MPVADERSCHQASGFAGVLLAGQLIVAGNLYVAYQIYLCNKFSRL
jgi:hypothetical protein